MFKDLLEAAMAAPSAMAKGPWLFLVFQKSDTPEPRTRYNGERVHVDHW